MAERRDVPEELRGLPAQDRGVWLAVESVYEAVISVEGVERNVRTMTPFRDLTPQAQVTIITSVVPMIQALHSIALNPVARKGQNDA